MDTIRKLLQWAKSTISSQWGGTEGQMLDEALCCLGSRLQDLVDTLPAMNDLIDRAEWKSHKPHVAEVLGNLKDAVYDADDLLDELRWYMLNVKLQGNGSQSLSMDFFNGVTQGIFIRSVDGIQLRLDKISTRLCDMGLREVSTRFDKSVRPQTSSFTNEENFIGREKKLDEIIEFLCKPRNSSRSNPKRLKGNIAADVSTSNQVSNKSSIKELTVYPIVGIGGVGKTTLAQHICSDARVKSYFGKIIWICVSDDFDVQRLTKEIIESCPGKQPTSDNLNILQTTLSEVVSKKKFLIVLDDIWDDALKENGQRWKTFCAPLKNMMQGGVMMVTTRCQKVANRVATGDCITLEGLDDDVFWNLFKLCVFESGNSNKIDPELERIGRSIITKLKGSPLAAKTLGRILRVNHEANYWKGILESELWTLKQDENDILPALRLSYIYLPVHLKRCFSLCAVYEKDYQFERDYLVEIWVAEGFVYPQGNIPVQDIGCEYFNELLYRSFFQKVQGKYVIHDLLHDMAQKVSEFECLIVKRKSDFTKIPDNVRHLSILSSTDIGYSDLLGLRRCTKLRTLLCSKPLADKQRSPRLIKAWCNELRQLRVIVLASIYELPATIGNLKHLRYLQINKFCPLKSLPEEFCWLYYVQIVRLHKCKLESLPTDFSKLICLQTLVSHGFACRSICRRFQREEFLYGVWVDTANDESVLGFGLIKNINHLGQLVIYNIGRPIFKELAEEAQLQNKKYLETLNLIWLVDTNIEENLQFLQHPTSLKSLLLKGYQGVSLPIWSQPENLPSLISPSLITLDLIIDGCQNLSSLEHVIHLAWALKKLAITNCQKLVSIPAERFGDLRCLEELKVQKCPSINAQSLVAPSLQRLVLGLQEDDYSLVDTLGIGNLADNVDCCSLTYFFLSCNNLTSIQLQKWNLPALEELCISECLSLTSIIGQSGKVIGGTGGGRAFKSLTSLTIERCSRLSTIDGLLAEEYLPAVERIRVKYCDGLVSLPAEMFGHFSSLKELEITSCGTLSWMAGFALPSSLQILSLARCGDISAWVPSLLQNLSSLVTLKIVECQHITSIPGDLWTTSLTSLENLMVWGCRDIVSTGGVHAITEIKNIAIDECPKLEEVTQPMLRGSYVGMTQWEVFTLVL